MATSSQRRDAGLTVSVLPHRRHLGLRRRYAKALAAGIVGYAFSRIDLIPDFIPVLGYLDELVLLPLGIMAVRAMIPGEILAECRERAARLEGEPRNWIAAAIIVAIWLCLYWLASRIGWSS